MLQSIAVSVSLHVAAAGMIRTYLLSLVTHAGIWVVSPPCAAAKDAIAAVETTAIATTIPTLPPRTGHLLFWARSMGPLPCRCAGFRGADGRTIRPSPRPDQGVGPGACGMREDGNWAATQCDLAARH